MKLSVFLNLIRYKSYLKNFIIFLPLFLNYTSWSGLVYVKLLIAFILFSFLASSIYIINDLADLEVDRNHIKKRLRPIASGNITKNNSIKIFAILSFVSLFLFFIIFDYKVFLLTITYFILNFFYSYFLKKIKYFEVLIVSSGFLIRLFIGAIISQCEISNFFILQIILFTSFILICKRREFNYCFETNNFSIYNIKELNILSKILLVLNIFNYFIYLFDNNRFIQSYSLELSFILFSILILRYFYLNFQNKNFDPISIYLSDKYLIFCSILYLINFLLGFYDFY